MAKSKANVIYVCQHCGFETLQWAGVCANCQIWNGLERREGTTVSSDTQAPITARHGYSGMAASGEIVSLASIPLETQYRIESGSTELDRVLGGGIVPGAVTLLGGDPGIGKSTILLQILSTLSQTHRALYASGEESLQQIAMRAKHLGLQQHELGILIETQVERIIQAFETQDIQLAVIDSIQTIFSPTIPSAPGSVNQLRHCTMHLVQAAKQHGISLFIVGHVTKEGHLAGPRVLEHMVDVVLYFEGERDSRFRMIRAVKNRFGAVNELGIFAMTDKGLKPVDNPSALFLSRPVENLPGSSVLVTWEGTRPLLVEIQALVDPTQAQQPRRISLGLDPQRLTLLLAILHRHASIATHQQDVFINVVGGIRIQETAVDLAVLLAILSSHTDTPLPKDWVAFGEVGLAGEIRPIQNGVERLKAAAKHGFTHAIIPKANFNKNIPAGLEVHPIQHLRELMQIFKNHQRQQKTSAATSST